MKIYGFNKSTLLDYPKHLAATIFVGSCNMRCPFCHNASLVLYPHSQTLIPEEDIFAYLKKRKNILEGVCITGGEPTLYSDLPLFISQIKDLGFKVKLDTNGSNPAMISKLMDEKLIDYIAMDIKNSKEKYLLTTGSENLSMDDIENSVSLILRENVDYEFRTTVVNQLHTDRDMIAIGNWIKGAKAYYLQSFTRSGDIISPGFTAPEKETLLRYKTLLTPYVQNVELRGID